jgi:Exo-beta-D-glucosaminidase Ig-fold domain/F5/8 type C domain/Glycosyl hydrolases family 2/Glycosyl hydrolases family 2, sugar binding domain
MKNKNAFCIYFGILMIIIPFSGCRQKTDYYTRGVGIYPGKPSEDFSPKLVAGNPEYRNIARLRPVYHSSSWDYNLTGQLTTDGIIIKTEPDYISLSTSQGVIPKNEREWLLDHNSLTSVSIPGTDVWIQLQLSMGAELPSVTRINLNGSLTYNDKKPGEWQFFCLGSNDGIKWDELGKVRGNGFPGTERPNPFARFFTPPALVKGSANRKTSNPFAGFLSGPYGNDSTAPRPSFSFNFKMPSKERLINQSFELKNPVKYNFYKVILSAPCAENWSFGDFDFFDKDNRLRMVPSNDFKSAWMSAGSGQEWIYVDLGSSSTFDNIKLHWVNKAIRGVIQVSDDTKSWTDVIALPGNSDQVDDIKLKPEARGRYVRILMTESATGKNYILSEFEVFGKGGLTTEPKLNPEESNGTLYLSGGNWKIQRSSEVKSSGEEVSKPGYDNNDWVVATVPGTALVSYWNAGALPNPNYGDNQLMISESFFNSDFWYRDEFKVPPDFKRDRIFLNFDGINWKAEIFLNGEKIGRIDGAFIRGIFDVTDLIKPGQTNSIAVLIKKNENIGVIKEATATYHDKNGGILGTDNPTYHASIGWDWIPTIRGRNIGIWNDVFLSVTGPVTIEDPLVTTDLKLPDTTAADISLEVTLKNYKSETVAGILKGKYGNIKFEQEVSLEPSSSKVVKINPSNNPSLHIINPILWWPDGYGNPHLYNVELIFKTASGVSDKKEFKSGIRKMTFDDSDQILNIYINGRRFIARGGNWGFPESNLEYRGREYDIAVAYHADMNFNMIRNWVGQTADDEFFEACDRHGIMIWQDFCLANPADGPDPADPKMFIDNARDLIKRIRNHPSIAIYVGRNEGNPPAIIDTALRSMINELHPGLHYISNSAFGVVSGGGPYRALPVRDYFLLYGYNKLHSERGMPDVMTYESLKQTLPESALWPQNSQWGMHDYCLESAQSAASFNQMIETGFGKADNAKKFTELAQWINYSGYRGMFEGRSLFRQGLLLWMSHPAWPSMVWQTYDYYFEPTAAYFGCKKACEPIHIQWNPVFDNIEVVNDNAGNRIGLTAKAQLLNMNGSVQWEKEKNLSCKEDSTAICFRLEFQKSLTPVHFIRLTLKEGEKTLSDNFYWRGQVEGNYQALNTLPVIKLQNNTKTEKSGDNWLLTTTLTNTSKTPALMVRMKVIGKNTGERILPVFYSDNYMSLMPAEKKVITMKLKDEDTRGEKPVVEISGFNLAEK